MRPSHLSLSLLALVAALLPAGCADQDPSILLTGYYFATGTEDEDTGALSKCVYPTAAGTDTSVAQEATINLQNLQEGGQRGSSGHATFVFGANAANRLQANASGGGSLRVDTNIALLKSANVRFLFSTPLDMDPRPFSVTIPANSSAGFGIPLINGAGDVQALKDAIKGEGVGDSQVITVTAEITVSGTLLDGTDVESNVLEFPVNLCVNCGDLLGVTPSCIAE